MLNAPWIDPRDVDWTDPFNPLTRPRWRPETNPFLYEQFSKDPIWLAMRNAKQMDIQILIAPDPIDQLIGGSQTYNQNMSCEPYTWLLGVSCFSSLAAGFYFQITDAVTGATVFSQQVLSTDFQPNTNDCFVWLPSPRYFIPPSYPIVRIVNNSNSAQTCLVNMYTAIELGPALEANKANS
jgi:hypothetical protein